MEVCCWKSLNRLVIESDRTAIQAQSPQALATPPQDTAFVNVRFRTRELQNILNMQLSALANWHDLSQHLNLSAEAQLEAAKVREETDRKVQAHLERFFALEDRELSIVVCRLAAGVWY